MPEEPGDFEWLQRWYESHCDDDWEHQYGISIDTLDNPGWLLKVDLKGTGLEGRTLDRVKIDTGDTDWWHYWVENDRFEAAGGARNLGSMVRAFREWAEEGAE